MAYPTYEASSQVAYYSGIKRFLKVLSPLCNLVLGRCNRIAV